MGTVPSIEEAPCSTIPDNVTKFKFRSSSDQFSIETGQDFMNSPRIGEVRKNLQSGVGNFYAKLVPIAK